jgi:hypothetical protein
MNLKALSDEDLIALKSGDLSKVSDAGLMALKGPTQVDQNGPQDMPMFSVGGTLDQVKNMGMGAIRGAARIGTTALSPLGGSEERKASIDQFFNENADPNAASFKVGDVGAQLAGTAGAGGLIAKGLKAVPALAKFAPAVESGGFNLGGAATANPLANALLRAGGGAVQGGAQTAMVSPEQTGTGTMIGAAAPGVVRAAGVAGTKLGEALDSGSRSLMQSALKPTIKQLKTGQAKTTVDTLLEEGIPATVRGVEMLRERIGGLNDEISTAIKGSNATINKQDVIKALSDPRTKFGNQVAPAGDLAAIQGVEDAFIANPTAPAMDIPVQLAQELKQGTYRVLKGKYGQLGSAETEAQKALARGLKEGIAGKVPEVAGLNARESKLLAALDVTERRALMDANKNPVGLSWLASNPTAALAFMADRSAAFKSVAAKMINNAAKGASQAKALENFAPQQGLLGAPSVLSANP